MRYLALLGISCISMILTACISPAIPILGAQLDFLLAAMVCMVLLERTMTPVFYIAGAAIWMDAFFAASMISSLDAPGLPTAILFAMES